MNTTNLDLSDWLFSYKATAAARRAARHQAARAPRPRPVATPARPEPKPIVSHFAKIRSAAGVRPGYPIGG
jgi:hypothetical protein